MRASATSLGLITLGLLMAAPALAVADDQTQTPEQTTHTASGVVVNAPPPPAPLTSTFTQSTISSVQIERLSPAPTMTVQTMLNSQPSIFAFTDAPFGVRSTITFRAFNSGEFTETYDGISLNDSFNAAVTGGAENVNNVLLQTQDIDSVQVYRGVNNPDVNGYNSLGGTINFVPKSPSETLGGEAQASYGSFNTFQAYGTFNTGDFHGLQQMGTFSYGRSDGWQKNTGVSNYNFYYALTYSPTDSQTLRFYSIVNHNQGSPPDNIPLPLLQTNGFDFQWPINVHNHHIDNTDWLGILDYQIDFGEGATADFKAFAGWDSYKRTSFTNPADENNPYFLDDGSTFPFWLPQFSSNYAPGLYNPGVMFGGGDVFNFAPGEQYHFYGYETWTTGYQPRLTLSLPRNNIVMGGNLTWAWLWSREYWWATAAMPMISGFNDAWDEWDYRFLGSIYIQDEISIIPDKLTVTPGVKYLYAHTADTDHFGFFYPFKGTAAGDEGAISPTIGFNYKPISTFAIYGAFGQNIKFPDITAFYNAIETDINGNLFVPPVQVKPEHVNDYELGARYQSGGLSLAVNVYREDFTNTFVTLLINGGNNSETVNGGGSRYQGVEVQFQDAIHWLDSDWTAYANYAHNQAKFTSSFTDQATGDTILAGTPLADVPEDLVSAGVTWSRQGWEANLSLRYVGRQFTDQAQLGTVPTPNAIPSYVVVDLGVSKTFSVETMGRNGSVKVGINVDNLFDERYFNEGFTDFTATNPNFLRVVVGPPLGVTGSVSAKF